MIYRRALRPAVFATSRQDPERAHELVVRQLAFTSRHPHLVRRLAAISGAPADGRTREVFGVPFPGPVGIAAGFDKNGVTLPALAALGFGFLEAGTVTWRAQEGHPRPRTWRFGEHESLINAMGFPNRGAEAVARFQQTASRATVPVGWNVSKSMATDIDGAADDVCASIRALHPYATFFVVNVSSPNTPGLRQLEGRDRLEALLKEVQRELASLADSAGLLRPRPVLVKISPDLSNAQMDDVVEVALQTAMSGVVATNTTIRRDWVTGREVPDRGGLSGQLLADRSVEVVRHLATALGDRLPIVGVGGIASPDGAQRMLDAGARLVQLYTGLIYEGPGLIRRINSAVRESWLTA